MANPDLYELIKSIAKNAMDASRPTNILFGKVISASPLSVYVNQKLTIPAEFLTLTRGVTTYRTTMTIDGDRKSVTVHNGLSVGDAVVLMQEAGGQNYVVIDKVGG